MESSARDEIRGVARSVSEVGQKVVEQGQKVVEQGQKVLEQGTSAAVTGTQELLRILEEIQPSTYVAATAGAGLVSLALMMLPRERWRHWSLFVGLWAPTILNLGLYSRLRRVAQERAGSGQEPGGSTGRR